MLLEFERPPKCCFALGSSKKIENWFFIFFTSLSVKTLNFLFLSCWVFASFTTLF